MALLYPDEHPYGRRTKGTVEVVEAPDARRARRLHAERFAPSELTAVVVGDVECRRVRSRRPRASSAAGAAAAAPRVLPAACLPAPSAASGSSSR